MTSKELFAELEIEAQLERENNPELPEDDFDKEKETLPEDLN